jgi:phosphoglycolate phosphatase
MTNRLAIFDCDGTLVDSQHNIVAAMNDAFVMVQLEPPARTAILSVVGLSLVEAMQRLLPDASAAMHAAMAEHYKQAFWRLRGKGLVDEPLYDGIADLIAALADDGWLLGVATGKSDRGLTLCLEHHGLTKAFVTLQTADRHPSKPHPSMIEAAMAKAGAVPETTVMIGDTSYDMIMARTAGARALGVGWGYHSASALRAAGAHAVADHPANLMTLLEPA